MSKMSERLLEHDAVSTLTISTEDMSISSEGADDRVEGISSASSAMHLLSSKTATKSKTRRQLHNSISKRYSPPQAAPCFGFRRCSLEHARRTTSRCTENDTLPSQGRPQRRSSLKSGPSTYAKNVAFSNDVYMKKIPHRNNRYLEAAWLSREERSLITEQAKTDMRIVKHLSKNPELAARSDMVRLRNLISVRGMEHLYSRKTMGIPRNERESVMCAVLEAQQRMGNSHSSSFSSLDSSTFQGSVSGDTQMADYIARVCAECSLPSRQRARRLALGDEKAVRSYLGRNAKQKLASSSISSTHFPEQEECTAEPHLTSHAESSSRTLGSLDSFGIDNEDGGRQYRRSGSNSSSSSSCFKLNIADEPCEDDSAFFVYP